MTDTEEIAHRWQNFRIRCLELAIAGGAQHGDMIAVAERLGDDIIKKSELELKARETSK